MAHQGVKPTTGSIGSGRTQPRVSRSYGWLEWYSPSVGYVGQRHAGRGVQPALGFELATGLHSPMTTEAVALPLRSHVVSGVLINLAKTWQGRQK